MAVERVQYRFTTAEYYRLAELGFIPQGARVELIDGEILETSPVGPRHRVAVDRLTALFAGRLDGRVIVRVQSPVSISDGQEPGPDITLLRYRADFYAGQEPTPLGYATTQEPRLEEVVSPLAFSDLTVGSARCSGSSAAAKAPPAGPMWPAKIQSAYRFVAVA